MNPVIVSEEPLTVYETKKLLAATKKRDEELTIRGAKCEEYVKLNTPLTQKDADALKKAIIGLEIARLKEDYVCKIIDLLPQNVEDIKVVLSSFTVTVKNDDLKRIDDEIAKFR